MSPKHRVTWLQTIRILSRDRSCLDLFASRQSLHALACYADIADSEAPLLQSPDMEVLLESLKCLCNLVLSSPTAQMLAAEARLVVRLADRVGLYRKRSYPHDVQFFDLRLLFLLTALRTDVRQQLFQELHGVRLLTDALELTLGVAPKENPPATLPAQETERAMEILKVLFNITFDSVKSEVDEVGCSLKSWLGLSWDILLPFEPQVAGCQMWQSRWELKEGFGAVLCMGLGVGILHNSSGGQKAPHVLWTEPRDRLHVALGRKSRGSFSQEPLSLFG